jgi:hypothetical protein
MRCNRANDDEPSHLIGQDIPGNAPAVTNQSLQGSRLPITNPPKLPKTRASDKALSFLDNFLFADHPSRNDEKPLS